MTEKVTIDEHGLPTGYLHWWAEVADHLGGIYPFQDKQTPTTCSLEIGSLIHARRTSGGTVSLDPVALVTKATLPYLLGNRTLIKGIQRAPWMSRPDEAGSWHTVEIPPHGKRRPDPDSFVKKLKNCLLDEARSYIKNAKTVGILLSGGMDSRILAGVLRAVQNESDGAFAVVGLTWGRESSRDVVYARRIAERFNWEWQHFPLTPETLKANISQMAQLGAEVSPLHLHAMPQIALIDGIDVVIAGSYGDSVGRAEFSGRRVSHLRSILPERLDRFGVLRVDAVRAATPDLRADLNSISDTTTQSPNVRRFEIEQEAHYMRRMLQSCMLSIARHKRFYQLFTSPDVFGCMWSLEPHLRDDSWYSRLLPLLPGDLLEIPWARTGRRYDRPDGTPDTYSNKSHAYGIWLRTDLRPEILRRVNSERIRGLGIFNDIGLDRAIKAWGCAHTESTNSLDELFSWLACLHDFIEIYQIEPSIPSNKLSWRDNLSAFRGGATAKLYITSRDIFRD